MLNFLKSAAERVLIWAICREAERRGIDLALIRPNARKYVAAAWTDALSAASFSKSDVEIQTARLANRYDLGMALNEAANRAIADKKVQREAPQLSGRQLAALEVQKQYLQRIVERS